MKYLVFLVYIYITVDNNTNISGIKIYNNNYNILLFWKEIPMTFEDETKNDPPLITDIFNQ